MNKVISKCVLSCLCVGIFSGCWMSSDSDKNKNKQQSQVQQAPDLKAEVKNAADLIAWIKIKNKQTELQRKESFAKFKNKYVVFKGNVRNVGKTAFGGKTYVSLRVDKLDMFENINIQFNVPEALKDTVATWMKDEVHVMRGQITGTGDLEDDAVCSNGSVVDNAKYAEVASNTVCDAKAEVRKEANDAIAETTLSGRETSAKSSADDVKINMDEVKAAIRTWQKDRWNADAIVKARQANGKLKVDDLKVAAKYKDLQPVFDLMVADYVIYVNVIDAFADAATAGEAVAGLLKSISFEDILKMAKDIGKVVDSAKSIKDKAGWKDAIPIGKDMITITALSSSMTNATGILKSIFDQVTKK